jgi:hypothetical protein
MGVATPTAAGNTDPRGLTPMSDDFRSELKALVDSHARRLEQAKESALRMDAEIAAFHKAWNEHRALVVDPILKEIATALQGTKINAEVREVQSRKVLMNGGTAVIPDTYDVTLQLTGIDVRATGSSARKPGAFEVRLQGREIVIEYPSHHRRAVQLSEITAELIQTSAMEFLKDQLGPA